MKIIVYSKCILCFFFFFLIHVYTWYYFISINPYFNPCNFWKYVRCFVHMWNDIRNESMRTNIKTFPIKKHYLINSLDEKETNIVASGKATREKARKYEYV